MKREHREVLAIVNSQVSAAPGLHHIRSIVHAITEGSARLEDLFHQGPRKAAEPASDASRSRNRRMSPISRSSAHTLEPPTGIEPVAPTIKVAGSYSQSAHRRAPTGT